MNKKINLKNKILLSSLGLEFLLILFVILTANIIIPLSKIRLNLIAALVILFIGTAIWLYFENQTFYEKHKKKFNIALTIVLILIAMIFTGYIRSYTYNMPIADNWAEDNIYSNLRSQFQTQVQSQYPNLPPEQINSEVNLMMEEFLKENEESITLEKNKIAESLRSQFQADNGQTYFLAIDPYYYHTISKNLLENGYQGDDMIDGKSILTRKLAPAGVDVSRSDFHPWLESILYKLNGLDETSTNGERMKAVYFLPVLFSMLSIIPLFLVIKKYSSNLFAFLGSLSFATVSTFLSRTMAGFVDTDAYNVFFPLLILALVIYSLHSKNKWTTIILASLAGLSQIAYLWAWGNGWFSFLFIISALVIYILYLLLVEIFSSDDVWGWKIRNSILVFIYFLSSSFVFSLIAGRNILSETFSNILHSSGGISLANVGNIWPNVLSSVAELNPASFGAIMDSVGGKIVFFFSLLGILLLSLDFKLIEERSISSIKIIKKGSKLKKIFLIILFGGLGYYFWFKPFIKKLNNGINKLNKADLNKTNKIINFIKIFLSLAGPIWFLFFILNFTNMGLLGTFHDWLIGLTTNSPISFLFWLFLPIILSIGVKLATFKVNEKTFLTMLLGVWIAGTIYMSFNGIRFILLLAPAFAIAFGIGLYYVANLISNTLSKLLMSESDGKPDLLKYLGTTMAIVLFVGIFCFHTVEIEGEKHLEFGGQVLKAHNMAMGTVPNFDDNWFNIMNKIQENSEESAIITSWWDFGHFYISIGQRGATFDGGSQTTPRAHWVGKLLMENDEDVATDILKMLVCGGNEAFNTMMDKTNDSTGGILINKILSSTFGKTNKEEILKNNPYFEFSNEDISEIMEELSCEQPPENFVITSEDMVSKTGVWAHWGSWDFSRKYILDNYKKLSTQEISTNIDESEELVEQYVSQLQDIDLRSNLKNIKRSDLINQWLAPYPNYMNGASWIPCTKQENILNCQVVGINLNTLAYEFKEGQGGNVRGIFFSENTFREKIHDENGVIDLVIKQSGDGSYQLLATQAPLGGSLFTKLFFLDGAGTSKFEKFDQTRATNGWNIGTWKVMWD